MDNPLPSLGHIVLKKIATILCSQDIVKASAEKPVNWKIAFQKGWPEIENRIIEKISLLSLPRYLETRLLALIEPVSQELFNWRNCHENILLNKIPTKSIINFWATQLHTNDNKKSVQILIEDENIDITVRYKLACFYCMEHEILGLWDKMSQNQRNSFYSKDLPKIGMQNVFVSWAYGKLTRLRSLMENRPFCSFIFEWAVTVGNRAAEYCLGKLPLGVRKYALELCATSEAPRRQYFLFEPVGADGMSAFNVYEFARSHVLNICGISTC